MSEENVAEVEVVGKKHRLSNVDLENKTADCEVCGGGINIYVRVAEPGKVAARQCTTAVNDMQRRRAAGRTAKAEKQQLEDLAAGQLEYVDRRKGFRHKLSHVNMETGLADCSVCGPQVPIKVRNTPRRSGSIDTSCLKAYNQTRAGAHVLRRNRESDRKIRTGMPPEMYTQLMEEQGGRCAICGEIPTKVLCADHSHASGRPRQLLCNFCNSGLGMFLENESTMRQAILYLAKHQKPHHLDYRSQEERQPESDKRYAPRHALHNLSVASATADCSRCGSNIPVKLIKGRPPRCLAAYTQARQTDAFRKRQAEQRRAYISGFPHGLFDSLLEQQGGRCAICDKIPTKILYADHAHVPGGYPRGLLCQHCNTGLGMFRDTPTYIENAIGYLEKHT